MDKRKKLRLQWQGDACRKQGHDHAWKQSDDDLELDQPAPLSVVRTACRRCGEVFNVYIIKEPDDNPLA